MNPSVTNVEEELGTLRFRLVGVNVSIANALRRIILSEIPTVIFKTEPYTESKMTIEKNTTRLNNEIIKQRFSCIPIHITDTTFNLEDHEVELDVANTSGSIQFVTTRDLKIKNVTADRYLTDDAVFKIFPPDPITKDWIIIARLRPRTSNVGGESLKLKSKLDIGIAKTNSAYNVVATCSYRAAPDPVAVNAAWTEYDKQKSKENNVEWQELRDSAKVDWLLLDGKRHVLPDVFDFVIESVGVFDNADVIYRGCDVMINKLKVFVENIQAQPDLIKPSTVTIDNCVDITLQGEDYTLGKVIEYVIYEKHFQLNSNANSDKTITYCGFNKPHPHIDESIIRIGFDTPREATEIVEILTAAANDAIQVFEKIGVNFNERD